MPAFDLITNAAIDILDATPEGMKTGPFLDELRARLSDTLPAAELGRKRLHPVLLDFARQAESPVYQPGRGLFRLKKFQNEMPEFQPSVHLSSGEKVAEKNFYKPFAEWLMVDSEECTKAIEVGAAKLGGKFGTPDVVGILKPSGDDLFKLPEMEIVCAEIKASTDGLIIAFGQACSYRLFSHRSYIVVPDSASEEDSKQLESLCLVCGIGLVVFDCKSPDKPNFRIRTRPARNDPDYFYVNKQLKAIAKDLLN